MGEDLKLAALTKSRQPSVTDAVYGSLYNNIVRLDMPPGTKLSEADVAKKLDVSRQPVRDAFYRLSQQGFLLIRPQRATVVTKISKGAVLRAQFVRTALEIETITAAMSKMTPADLADLERNLDAQSDATSAGHREVFQDLDDQFHALICRIAGHPEVWDLIKDTKAHMDRVRYLTLSKGTQAALKDHEDILAALRSKDASNASALMRQHLSKIGPFMEQILPEHSDYFEEDDREY